jgi:hypothetical protein
VRPPCCGRRPMSDDRPRYPAFSRDRSSGPSWMKSASSRVSNHKAVPQDERSLVAQP